MLPFEAFILIDDSLRRAELPAQDRTHHVTLNSDFLSHGKSQPEACGTTPVRSITLARAQAETSPSPAALKSPSDPKKGRTTTPPRTEDLVTEQHLITLLQKLGPTLKHLHLRELAFTSFRRRHLTQLTPLLSSSNLQLETLTVIGRPAIESQFQFHALASILLCLPNLSTLVMRHIRASTPAPSAAMGRMPSFKLVSISVRDCPSFMAEHYYWLFASTMYADSLCVLDFEYPHPRAAPLRPIAWLGWPVRSLRLTTSAKGVIEGFAHNLPSLERLEINATGVAVDIIELLGNLQKPPVELADTSMGDEDGFDPRVMAVVLEVGWPRTQFRKICIRRRQGWTRLEAACKAKAVELIELK
ncbi:BZ3500_MvSof-1268-A1-R1_Chr2-3g05330 [Microbotryum saponariae]|uniref:BZ3500_MvSof-1268-A1-R1_Chr2-3g05330 protein n=1 Tax=Microbotryum saponariae TaxID=289078 RepID=A0A2X0K533_9BASI|nr:BZ3500_MvSof-1268-A1-R1_Chr2-3g05330 [Microbotryum saponariae]SDA01212.1 BZ3501_MvSof-1269-A2-R1_Chr2-2g05003 [Microbotryum saponariae]